MTVYESTSDCFKKEICITKTLFKTIFLQNSRRNPGQNFGSRGRQDFLFITKSLSLIILV